MATYRIIELGSRAIVGTDEEAVLICASIEVAHRAVADARLLETLPAKLVFFRRPAPVADERRHMVADQQPADGPESKQRRAGARG